MSQEVISSVTACRTNKSKTTLNSWGGSVFAVVKWSCSSHEALGLS